jgi:TonB family protein
LPSQPAPIANFSVQIVKPMFQEFYQLREQPFGSNPDPRFLYLSRTHREAFSSLYYRLQTESGFMAMIAEPGMGKTTLLFHLLHHLQPTARTAFIFQTQCDSCELQRQLLSEFNCDPAITDRVRMQQEFKAVLLREANAGRACIAIIDEAQNLGAEVLETVRLLSNFETPRRKLLQIVLSGQRELGEILNRPELHQLRQRLSCVVQIQRFGPDETVQYIAHRLAIAGFAGRLSSLFDLRALVRITQASDGIPRVINNICFNSLSLGFAMGRKQIGPEIIDEVANDLGLASQPVTPGRETATDQFLIAALEQSLVEIGDKGTSDLSAIPIASPAESELGSPQRLAEARDLSGSLDLREPTANPMEPSVVAAEVDRCVSPCKSDLTADNQGLAEAGQPATVGGGAERRRKFLSRGRVGSFQGEKPPKWAKLISWGTLVVAICTTPALRSPARDRSMTAGVEVTKVPRQMPFSGAASSARTPSQDPEQKSPTASSPLSNALSSDPRPKSVVQDRNNVAAEKVIENKRDSGPPLKAAMRPREPRLVLVTQHLQSDELIGIAAGPRGEEGNAANVINGDVTDGDASRNLLPKPIVDPSPVYPARAQQLNIAGEVLLLITVSSSGDVASVQLLRGDALLAAAAEEAVKKWKYSPAIFDGAPADSRVFVSFQFKLQ